MLLELLQGLLISESIMLSHLLDNLTDILSQFTLGNTTTATVFIFQSENLEIVQLAKDAELTKLGVTPPEVPTMLTKRSLGDHVMGNR